MISATAALAGANDQFIANVAHQLRYPLVPIRNAAALLKGESLDPGTIERIADLIERHTNGLHRLIGDLVDVSQAEMGTLTLQRSRAPVSRVIELALETASALANERGHTLSVSITPAPLYVHGDAARLSQALYHLLANACKYMERHGHVVIRAQQEGLHAVITVTDTGDGIHASELDSIFGLFVHGNHGRRAEPGLGLGLYLARHLIESHGGTLFAESAGVGRGSAFTIKLPCEAATVPSLELNGTERAGDPSRA